MDKTAQILAEMLKENTGAHFLDSGGAYGRHHEQNQGRDFETESPVFLSFKYGIEYTKNVYHFLKDALEYDPTLNGYLARFVNQDKDTESWNKRSWNEIRETFPEYLNAHARLKQYKGRIDHQGTYNSYNGEDALSQVILYTLFSIDNEFDQYVALQIHNGCDVRGGYTRPYIFALTEEFSIMQNARGDIYCIGTESETWENRHIWTTDDALNWYADGSTGRHSGKHLDQYPIIDVDDLLFEVDANTDDLEEYLTDTIADAISKTSLGECIREYRQRYDIADLEPKNKYSRGDYLLAIDILIYKRLIQLNAEYMESTLPLDLPGGKDKLEMLESEMIPYQRIIDRQNKRKAETRRGNRYSYRLTTTKIMERHQNQRRQVIDDLKYERRKYHEDRSFILANGDEGLCPLCQAPLEAY